MSIPSWRPDCEVEVDLVEEVARHYGYDRIGKTVPPAVRFGALTPAPAGSTRRCAAPSSGSGCSEAMPMAFLAPGDQARAGLGDDGITITNPLVADESVLRTSLLPGLLKSVAYNLSHRNDDIRLFEIGHVFRRPSDPASELPDERENLAVAIAGDEAPAAVETWWALAEHLAVPSPSLRAAAVPGLHPTRAAEIVVDGEVVGAVGEVDPGVLDAFGIGERVAWLEVDLGRRPRPGRRRRPVRAVQPLPVQRRRPRLRGARRRPGRRRAGGDRRARASELARRQPAVRRVPRARAWPRGSRSLAFRLRFQAPDRTLTDAEIGAARSRVIAAVEQAVPAKLRG